MSLAEIDRQLTPLRVELASHPLYSAVRTPEALRAFMGIHVAAVWDFMTLVKRLQHELTCTSVAFAPPADPELARFVNELVLGEESDEGPDGSPLSHLELYLRAMDEVGADTLPMERLLAALRRGAPAELALRNAGLPEASVRFSELVLGVALRGRPEEVAAHLLWGREDPIPDMFDALLAGMGPQHAPTLRYYLHRHVVVDGDSHGPLARALVERLVGDDELGWHRVADAAEQALRGRLTLWDAALAEVDGLHLVPLSPAMPQHARG